MAEIKNTFLKGKMNQDLDSRILPNGEYREARNLSISRSESSTVGEFENVLGNTAISSLTAIGASATTEIIGQLIDENSNVAYFLATDYDSPTEVRATAADNCYIVKVDLSVTVNTNPIILVQGFFLNFNKSFPVTGINLVEDLLFWTDNLNQPRKINIARALADATHYTNEDQISVAKYAPYEPILVMDRVNAVITSPDPAVSTATIIIDDDADYALIKVGDIVTDKNKITNQQITGLVTVIGKPDPAATRALTLSSAITVTNGTAIDFSRPSMTNKRDFEMANHSSGPIVRIVNGGSPNPINTEYSIGYDTSKDSEFNFIYGGKNGIPEIGDLVSGNGISSDTRIASVSVVNQYKNPTNTSNPDSFQIYQEITFTLNKTTTLASTDVISISDNPNYDAAWQGDEKLLEDKFIRFSYRFKFEDNEYSLMAPFSQVMFIPKQYSQFGGGSFSDEEDMDNTYKSTIVNWFENNINNILLKIPMPSTSVANTISELKITDVDILYKESDALAVKVLETVNLLTPTPVESSIEFYDAVHGNNTKHFIDYDYSSTKPYKTLPNNQITRVSDKVPIRALAQEIIGNRVVYGNYLDRHTGPDSIAFSAFASNKSTNFDNYTQFPKHQLKQDRTYQVGFVLSDKYGRQSDVILSSYDGVANTPGSTVFNPYNDLTTQQQSPILDWLGNALNVTLYEQINPAYSLSTGSPGLYSATNPLGWYSYKIVVKQTEQEYYNVYLPGFVNGYPITGTQNAERDTSFFTTLLGDNINKIPRDLSEVGPNDKDFTSSENIMIRINNPRINNKTIASPPYLQDRAWNAQYYPGNIEQEIIQIGTVRDLEIQAIPFKADALEGEYGESDILQTYNYEGPGQYEGAITGVNETPEPTGAIPWGTTGPDATFYNGDSNPFIIKGSQSQNKNNPIGAYVTTLSVNTIPTPESVLSMMPFLSIAETKPVESLLDIYWETSLSGNLATLNSLVSSQDSGLIGSNFQATTFTEGITSNDIIGFGFNFLKGDGQLAPASAVTLNSITITDGADTVLSSTLFTISKNAAQTSFQIKPTNTDFFYSNSILQAPLTGVYNITANVTYATNSPDDIVLPSITLTNVAPTIDAFTQPTPSAAIGTIITLTGKNGSADATVNTTELNWSIVSISPVETPAKIQINATTGELSNDAILTDATFYSISVKATDCNGNGLDSIPRSVEFQIGSAAGNRVNAALCQGWQGSAFTGCGESLGVVFAGSRFTPLAVPTSSVTVGSVTYLANNAANSYNVFDKNQSTGGEFVPTVNHTTGALEQGTLYITPTLTNVGGSGSDDDTVTFTIQFKSPSGGGWVQAVDTSSATVNNVVLQVGNDATASSKKVFTAAGEYRVLTTTIAGGMCSLGESGTSLKVNFGDENFSNCAGAPA